MKTGKAIPIKVAKDIANNFGYSQVIIHAYDGITNMQHVTTFGKTIADCDNAAEGGNTIKKLLKWDENLCDERTKRRKVQDKKLATGFIVSIMGWNQDGAEEAYETYLMDLNQKK